MEKSNFLASLKLYATSWTKREDLTEYFDEESLASIITAVVEVNKDYGHLQIKITRKEGICYAKISKDSTLKEGDIVDLRKHKIITLERGNQRIQRVE